MRRLPLGVGILAWVLAAGCAGPATPPVASPSSGRTAAPTRTEPTADSPTPIAATPTPTGSAWPSPLTPLDFPDVAPRPTHAPRDAGWVVSTLAGGPLLLGQTSGLVTPRALAFGANGDLYVADEAASLIRLIKPDGTLTAFAGSLVGYGDGRGVDAHFNQPTGLAYDAARSVLYVADSGNHCIRQIAADGTVRPLAGSLRAGPEDGIGVQAHFNHPSGLALDAAGDLYVADRGNHLIRKVNLQDPARPVVTTIAGTGTYGDAEGPGRSANFANPQGVTLGADGVLWVMDHDGHRIRRIDLKDPTFPVSTLVGNGAGSVDGPAASAKLNGPVALIARPGELLLTEEAGHRIRRVDLVDPAHPVTTIAGGTGTGTGDGVGTAAQFLNPSGLVSAADGTLYVADSGHGLIRKLVESPPGTWTVSRFAGAVDGTWRDGPGAQALFGRPTAVYHDTPRNRLLVADSLNHRIRAIDLTLPDHPVTTLAGGTVPGAESGGPGTIGTLQAPSAFCLLSATEVLVADAEANRVARLNLLDGTLTTLFRADGAQANTQTEGPVGLAAGASGTFYLASRTRHRLFQFGLDGLTTVFAGTGEAGLATDGTRLAATFYEPSGLTTGPDGILYVADLNHHTIRRIDPTSGAVTTLAGSLNAGTEDGPGTLARFTHPVGLAVDAHNGLFIADEGGNAVRRLDLLDPTHPVTTVAGQARGGFADGDGLSLLNGPSGIAVGPDGTIYVADTRNQAIRMIKKAP